MTPNAIQNYRDTTKRHASTCTQVRQICCKCKLPKNILGGIRKATNPGKISQYNPARFTCKDCRE